MGTWSAGITGNDTARDLYSEYTAAFYKYDVEEALARIDRYVRTELCDEADEAEWCNYVYSLANFMWKKGILTDAVRAQAIRMIDRGFGLESWAEAGQKALDTRKQKLAEFRTKLLSPPNPKKKIKPSVNTERILTDGDVIAVQLQTAGKPYTESGWRPLPEEDFHALDGKYVLMQLVYCFASWTSSIVPEVKDYWACFRLFDGFYDHIPENIDVSALKEAMLYEGGKISPMFTCESNLFYFKKRKYQVICNRKDLIANCRNTGNNSIFWRINTPWLNPDSRLVAAMGIRVSCGEYSGTSEELADICRTANRYGRYHYGMSLAENEARFAAEDELIMSNIYAALCNGGKLYSISFEKEIGIVTVENRHIGNLYIAGGYQRNGFGTRLLHYAFSVAGDGAYINVPAENSGLRQMCDRLGLVKAAENEDVVRMVKP